MNARSYNQIKVDYPNNKCELGTSRLPGYYKFDPCEKIAVIQINSNNDNYDNLKVCAPCCLSIGLIRSS